MQIADKKSREKPTRKLKICCKTVHDRPVQKSIKYEQIAICQK